MIPFVSGGYNMQECLNLLVIYELNGRDAEFSLSFHRCNHFKPSQENLLI